MALKKQEKNLEFVPEYLSYAGRHRDGYERVALSRSKLKEGLSIIGFPDLALKMSTVWSV